MRPLSSWETLLFSVVCFASPRVSSRVAGRRNSTAPLISSACLTRHWRCSQSTRPSLEGAVGVAHHGRYLPPASAVPGTWASLARDALKDTLKSHPATVRGGRKLKVQSSTVPCVLTRSRLSTTPPRLWPAAPLTLTVQGRRDYI